MRGMGREGDSTGQREKKKSKKKSREKAKSYVRER
jgi:hypothetical protein